jgi:hypothetical protein
MPGWILERELRTGGTVFDIGYRVTLCPPCGYPTWFVSRRPARASSPPFSHRALVSRARCAAAGV